MPEDNYLECMKVIAETMRGTGRVGEWYGKCLFFFRNVYIEIKQLYQIRMYNSSVPTRTLKLLLTLYFLSECGNCRYVYFIGEVRKYIIFFLIWTLEPKEDTKYFKLRKLS